MSGASAIASARRRRTGVQDGMANKSSQNSSQNSIIQENSNVQLSPLQILKLHDDKIKMLEEWMENNTNTDTNTDTDTNLDENKILEILSGRLEGMLSNRVNSINDTIKSMLLNIEKLSNIAKTNDTNLNKTEEFTNELNALKMLVIKNQTLSLEASNDIIKMKDSIEEIKSNLSCQEEDSMTYGNITNAESLFKTMFNNYEREDTFSKINIVDDDEEDITLKNIESLDIENIESIEDIKETIATEISEKLDNMREKDNGDNDNVNVNNNVNVNDNDNNNDNNNDNLSAEII